MILQYPPGTSLMMALTHAAADRKTAVAKLGRRQYFVVDSDSMRNAVDRLRRVGGTFSTVGQYEAGDTVPILRLGHNAQRPASCSA